MLSRPQRAQPTRVRYQESRMAIRAVLQQRGPDGRWRDLNQAVVSYPSVQRLLALQAGKPHLLPENAPQLLSGEVGWFGSSAVRKIKKKAKKIVKHKVFRGVAQAALPMISVTNAAAKYGAKSGIPVVATASKLHTKFVTPFTQKIGVARNLLPRARDPKSRAELERVIKLNAAKARAGQALVRKVTAKIARLPPAQQKAAARKVAHRTDAWKVISPDGNTIYVNL